MGDQNITRYRYECRYGICNVDLGYGISIWLSTNTVISHIDMGYLVTLPASHASSDPFSAQFVAVASSPTNLPLAPLSAQPESLRHAVTHIRRRPKMLHSEYAWSCCNQTVRQVVR